MVLLAIIIIFLFIWNSSQIEKYQSKKDIDHVISFNSKNLHELIIEKGESAMVKDLPFEDSNLYKAVLNTKGEIILSSDQYEITYDNNLALRSVKDKNGSVINFTSYKNKLYRPVVNIYPKPEGRKIGIITDNPYLNEIIDNDDIIVATQNDLEYLYQIGVRYYISSLPLDYKFFSRHIDTVLIITFLTDEYKPKNIFSLATNKGEHIIPDSDLYTKYKSKELIYIYDAIQLIMHSIKSGDYPGVNTIRGLSGDLSFGYDYNRRYCKVRKGHKILVYEPFGFYEEVNPESYL